MEVQRIIYLRYLLYDEVNLQLQHPKSGTLKRFSIRNHYWDRTLQIFNSQSEENFLTFNMGRTMTFWSISDKKLTLRQSFHWNFLLGYSVMLFTGSASLRNKLLVLPIYISTTTPPVQNQSILTLLSRLSVSDHMINFLYGTAARVWLTSPYGQVYPICTFWLFVRSSQRIALTCL